LRAEYSGGFAFFGMLAYLCFQPIVKQRMEIN